MKLGNMLKRGGERSSRVDTLPRHHNDPSPPCPGLSSNSLLVSARMQGYRSKGKAATTAATSYTLQELAQAPLRKKKKKSRLQMPAAPRQIFEQAGVDRDRGGSRKSRASETWANRSISRLWTLLLPGSSWECRGGGGCV